MKKNILMVFSVCVAVGAALYYFRGDHPSKNESILDKNTDQRPANVGKANTSTSNVSAESSASEKSKTDFFLNGTSFDAVKSLAEQGDAVAQRRLSEIYEDCFAYSLSPERYFEGMDQLSSMKPASKPHIEKIKKATNDFCKTVDSGQPIPNEAYKLWLKQSAQTGDLIADIRQTSRAARKLTPVELKNYADRVTASKDPEAAYEFSTLLGNFDGEWPVENEADVFRKQLADQAWAIAACRSGMNCSEQSRLMRLVCTNSMTCQYSSYEQFVFSEIVPPAQRSDLERMIGLIRLRFIKFN